MSRATPRLRLPVHAPAPSSRSRRTADRLRHGRRCPRGSRAFPMGPHRSLPGPLAPTRTCRPRRPPERSKSWSLRERSAMPTCPTTTSTRGRPSAASPRWRRCSRRTTCSAGTSRTRSCPTPREHDIGVLVYGPLAHGPLSGRMIESTTFDADDWRGKSPDFTGETFRRKPGGSAAPEGVRPGAGHEPSLARGRLDAGQSRRPRRHRGARGGEPAGGCERSPAAPGPRSVATREAPPPTMRSCAGPKHCA